MARGRGRERDEEFCCDGEGGFLVDELVSIMN